MLVLSISMLTYGVGPIGIDLFKKTSMVRKNRCAESSDLVFSLLVLTYSDNQENNFALLIGACDKS